MTFLETYLIGLCIVIGLMCVVWLISLALKDSSIVDIFWGTGFAIITVMYFLLTDGYETRRVIVLALVIIWGLRLSLHIGSRNMGKGEDFRYQKWREEAGASYWWVSFFKVFLLQGVVLWIVSAPLLAAQYHATPASLTVLDVLGILVWGLGFFFEAVGDWQLRQFKADPANKGQVMDRGLWRYTRHPNYFGDAVLWWGYFLLALSTPGGFLTMFSPILMTYLLVRVSGVAMLERTLKRSRPGYAEYIRRTSAFIPMPPKK